MNSGGGALWSLVRCRPRIRAVWPVRPVWPRRPARIPRLEEDVEVEERQKTAVPKRYKVIFHNDDYTTHGIRGRGAAALFPQDGDRSVAHHAHRAQEREARSPASTRATWPRRRSPRSCTTPGERAPPPSDGRAGVKANAMRISPEVEIALSRRRERRRAAAARVLHGRAPALRAAARRDDGQRRHATRAATRRR